MKPLTRNTVIGTLICGTLAGAGVLWSRLSARAAQGPPSPIFRVVRTDLARAISATGSVEPEYSVALKSRASGEIISVNVQEGDRVVKGAILARIDPTIERRRVTQTTAELQMARASLSTNRHKLAFARKKLARDRGLFRRGLSSKEAVETQQREVSVLVAESSRMRAQARRAAAVLSEARDRLKETVIRAPIPGTLLQRDVQPGQIVASSTNSVSGGTPLLVMADLSKLFVRVDVDEADIARIKPGQQVVITADALPNRKFAGRVLRVAPQGRVVNNVTVFQVVVQADAVSSKALRPKMTANVEIIVTRRPGVLTLPLQAVRRQSGRDRAFVWLAGGRRRLVRIGLDDGNSVEILTGLAEGDAVRKPPRKLQRGASSKSRPNNRRSGMRGMRRMMGGRR